MSTVIIGVGNAYRHDDGAGLAVAARLRDLRVPDVTIVESDGEPAGLLDCWRDAGIAFVVDAVRDDEAEPGSVWRAHSFAAAQARSSTHSFDLSEAWALGAVMSMRPEHLVVYGIVGQRFEPGPGLSSAVARAVGEVTAAIVDELQGTFGPGSVGERAVRSRLQGGRHDHRAGTPDYRFGSPRAAWS